MLFVLKLQKGNAYRNGYVYTSTASQLRHFRYRLET